jgi:2-phosphosulfolactate phosphatase
MPPQAALGVAFLPGEAGDLDGWAAIVVDVLRACSSIITLFDRGAQSIGLAESVEAARAAAKNIPGAVLCGEVGGLPPYGFDYGNSPVEFSQLDFSGKHIVMATTNGTAAVRACRTASATLVGALINANQVIRETFALLQGLRGVIIVCAGRQGRFVLDDAITAGYLTHIFIHEAKVRDIPVAQSNAAIAAYRLYHSYPNLLAALNESDSAQALQPLQLGHDVSYCAKTSMTKTVPSLGTTPRKGLYLL